jgi:tripartite-type tricarboxylate transporter receptor subunit TctC
VRDIAPVASIARFMGVLVATPSSPVKTVPDLIAHAKANPGRLTIASGGAGSSAHLYWELLKSITGIDALHVPYRGEAPALVDLLGGQVQFMIPNLPPSIEYIKTDKVRALAVTATTRSELLPNVPPMSEFVPGYEGIGWIGIGAPKNTPTSIIELLNAEVNRCLMDPAMRKRMTDLTATIIGGTASEFGKYVADYTDKWGRVIRAANIKL